ncbi:MAG: hypothetical protein CL565_04780 [Alphaproteobacteria bacterium]|nr:hypothetical protein [Alphaproteobacteria bacterium]|tara:strand:+ start:1195 stop:1575 length:381 start_codon:yes stop_codon:yes gene_type:complete
MNIKSFIAGMGFLSIIALSGTGCGMNDPVYVVPSMSNTQYYCDQNRQMVMSLGVNNANAVVLYDGNTIHLQRDLIESNIYRNNTYTLFAQEGFATLEREGVPLLTNCSVVQPERLERSVLDKIYRG